MLGPPLALFVFVRFSMTPPPPHPPSPLQRTYFLNDPYFGLTQLTLNSSNLTMETPEQ